MAQGNISRHFASLCGAAIIASGLVAAPAPATAQGFFDLLFGGFRRSAPPPSSYADPRSDGRDADGRRGDGDGRRGDVAGPGVSYCVRLCDGRHFPINYRSSNSSSSKSAAEICKSFCPASPTQIFSGGNIDSAYSTNGKRYSDLPNAFVYRDKIVPDCTCDGKSPTGLVRQDIDDDPTLRPGDIVATSSGLMAYRGESRRSAEFTPIDRSAGLSPTMRQQLSATRILPARTKEEVGDTNAPAPMSRNVDQRSQASR